jgi:hypothetical protein
MSVLGMGWRRKEAEGFCTVHVHCQLKPQAGSDISPHVEATSRLDSIRITGRLVA